MDKIKNQRNKVLKFSFYGIVIIISALLCWFVFYIHTSKTESRDRLYVVCTTSILADTVRAIGGEHIEVINLMGPGIDPHLYRAREGDVHRLAQADLVLYHGLHLEGRLADLLSHMHNYAPTYAVCDAIPKTSLRESPFKGLYDPHVWHDVSLWRHVVRYIGDILIQYDAAHAQEYVQATELYLCKLEELEHYIHHVIESISPEKRILVTAHDAFAYFGAAYGLQVIALQGISTESDISTRDVIDLAHFVVEHHINTLFLESSIPPRNLQAVQQAIQARGWHVQLGDELYSDALGDEQSDANTYISMIRHNIDVIIRGLL